MLYRIYLRSKAATIASPIILPLLSSLILGNLLPHGNVLVRDLVREFSTCW